MTEKAGKVKVKTTTIEGRGEKISVIIKLKNGRYGRWSNGECNPNSEFSTSGGDEN